MPRDDEGNVVEQCSSTYQHEANRVRCVKPRGHSGECTDARGWWRDEQTGSPMRARPADPD